MPRLVFIAMALLGCKRKGLEVDLAECSDTADAELAGLSGTVTRSAEPREDAFGDVYVALFTADPVWSSGDAELVAQHRIEDIDLSANDASVDYALGCIPPREEDYHLFAFLDDNGTATMQEPVPDGGDLISLVAAHSPEALLPEAVDYTMDVELNLVMPLR